MHCTNISKLISHVQEACEPTRKRQLHAWSYIQRRQCSTVAYSESLQTPLKEYYFYFNTAQGRSITECVRALKKKKKKKKGDVTLLKFVFNNVKFWILNVMF